MPETADRELTSGNASPIVQAAERLVSRIEALVSQVAALKADNAALRREVRAAVALIERAGDAATSVRSAKRAVRPSAPSSEGSPSRQGAEGTRDARVSHAGHRPCDDREAWIGDRRGDCARVERSWRPGVGSGRPLACRARGRGDHGGGRRPVALPAPSVAAPPVLSSPSGFASGELASRVAQLHTLCVCRPLQTQSLE